MKRRDLRRYIALAVFGSSAAAVDGLMTPDESSGSLQAAAEAPSPAPGTAATLHFTDRSGNPRNPTAAEARAAAQAFARDLERIAGPNSGKANVRTVPSGAVAATVATSRVSLLYAVENADGTVTIGHNGAGGDVRRPAAELPEE